MPTDWTNIIRRYRARHGLGQQQFAELLGVAQRTVSRWERGDDQPSLKHQKSLRDLCQSEGSDLVRRLSNTIAHCPVARALSRHSGLVLVAVSPPAVRKRPCVRELIGEPLAPLACGVLEEILSDRSLQRAIRRKEVAGLVTVTRGVLKTAEHPIDGIYKTTISYFSHDGILYSDAITTRGTSRERLGYWPILADDMLGEAD